MAGYKIEVKLKEESDQPARVELNIPRAVTFLDLHHILQVIFTWEDEDGDHEFTVGEGHVPVTNQEDRHGREMEESDNAIDRLLEAQVPITYFFYTPEEDYEVHITLLSRLGRYTKDVATCTLSEEILSINEKDELYSISAEEFTDMLEMCELTCLGSFAPTYEELLRKMDDHVEDQLKDMGLDMPTLMRKMDERHKQKTYIPQAPPSTGISASKQSHIAYERYVSSHPQASLTLSVSEKKTEEFLSRLNSTEAFDICKYVQNMDALLEGDEEKVHAIAEAYLHNPSLLVYSCLDEDSADDFLSIPSIAEKGGTLPASDALGFMVSVGLASYEDSGKIVLPRDLCESLKKLTNSKIAEVKRFCKKYDDGINVLVRHYGVLEFSAIRELMDKYFSVSLSQKQTNQIVYLRYSFWQMLKTCVLENSIPYAVAMELDVEKVMVNFYLGMGNFFPYAELDERAIRLWQNRDVMDFVEVYPGWSYLNAFLLMSAKVTREQAIEYLKMIYVKVRNGETLQQIMKCFQAKSKDAQIYERLRLWEICLHFMSGTGLPSLKGKSQVEVYKDPRYFMAMGTMFVENPVGEDQIGRNTHIDVFPTRFQLQIGSILFTLEEEDLPALRKLQRSFPDNIDLQFILGMAYQRLEQFKEAIQVFEKLSAVVDAKKDRSVEILLKQCRNEDMNRPIALYLDGMIKI